MRQGMLTEVHLNIAGVQGIGQTTGNLYIDRSSLTPRPPHPRGNSSLQLPPASFTLETPMGPRRRHAVRSRQSEFQHCRGKFPPAIPAVLLAAPVASAPVISSSGSARSSWRSRKAAVEAIRTATLAELIVSRGDELRPTTHRSRPGNRLLRVVEGGPSRV